MIWCILWCVRFLLTQCNSIEPKIWHLFLRNLWTTPCRCFTCFTWWLIWGMMPAFEFLLQKPHNGWKTEPWNVADGRLTSMKLTSGCIIYMLATPSKLKILGPKAMIGLHNIRNKPKLQNRAVIENLIGWVGPCVSLVQGRRGKWTALWSSSCQKSQAAVEQLVRCNIKRVSHECTSGTSEWAWLVKVRLQQWGGGGSYTHWALSVC